MALAQDLAPVAMEEAHNLYVCSMNACKPGGLKHLHTSFKERFVSKLKCAKLPAETIISFPDLALTKDSAMVATEEVRHLSSTFLVCLFETTLVVGCCLAG